MQASFCQPQCEPILQERLSRFGLNPSEWFVRALREKIFFAVHRLEPTLILVGEARMEGPSVDWNFLEVLETD